MSSALVTCLGLLNIPLCITVKAASVRNDAAAELDRLTRGSKKSTVAAPSALNNNDTGGGGGEAKSLNSSEC